jgi:hypothetical protein
MSDMRNLFEIGVTMYTNGRNVCVHGHSDFKQVHSRTILQSSFFWALGLGLYAAKNLLRLSRAFAATRRVLADLSKFHMVAPPAAGTSGSLSFAGPYPDSMPSLTFTHRPSRWGGTVVMV